MIKYRWLSGNEDYLRKLDEKLKKRLKNIFKFSNNDINTFVLLSKKTLYRYEYTDEWKKFDETALSKKEEVYNNLNMEDNTDVNYMHGKRVCKVFLIKNLGESHDLYLKSHNFWLMFSKFSEKCLQKFIM